MPPQPPPAPYGQAPGIESSLLVQDALRRWREGRGVPTYDERQERLQAAAMNEALRYMDPTTRGQYMRQMARDYPMIFGKYAAANVPPPAMGAQGRQQASQLLARERLDQAIAALAPGAIVGQLGGHLPRTVPQALKEQYITEEAQVPLGFLSDYLRTARDAYGTGVGRKTSAERAYAEQRLRQLGEQAQQKPEYAAMAQLGQALVNPVIGRPPTSGGLGTYGAVGTPPGADVRRGAALRNLALT